jgi:hypothetical protein
VTWIATGRSAASLDADGHDPDDDNDNDTVGGRDADDDGSSGSTRGLIGGVSGVASLPIYTRSDVQLRRDWRIGPAGGRLSAFVTLANVFNHANIGAILPGALGVPARPITLLPRSVLAGAAWAY